MPTILDLVGVPAPPTVQGRSLVPLLPPGDGAARGGAPVLSEFSAPERARVYESVRTDRYTYVIDGGEERLFDRQVDPGEGLDVARERVRERARLRRALERWRDACGRLGARLGPVGDGARPSADTVKQLRALGYVR
jgi:arylsulfatase A-like enzyme